MIQALSARADYPSLIDHVYLNQASLGLIGQPAVHSMHRFLDEIARHGNLRMTDEEELGFSEALRRQGARLLNCPPEQLAILAGASEFLGQLPFLLRPRPGASVILVSTDFPAVTRPWIRFAAENDISLVFVDDLASEHLTDRLIDQIDHRTATVAVSSVQFSTGTSVEIPRLREACSRFDAHLIVDATQAAGLLEIDSQLWRADAVVTSGYKWLGGHGGVALAALSPAFLEHTPPLPGWMGAPDPFAFDARRMPFAPEARRWTQSTMSYLSMVGLTTAIEQSSLLPASARESHSRQLAHRLIEGARTYGWAPFRPLDTPSACPHIVALEPTEFDAESVAEYVIEALRRHRIVCSARNGRVRVSLAPYNDGTDIDRLLGALASL